MAGVVIRLSSDERRGISFFGWIERNVRTGGKITIQWPDTRKYMSDKGAVVSTPTCTVGQAWIR